LAQRVRGTLDGREAPRLRGTTEWTDMGVLTSSSAGRRDRRRVADDRVGWRRHVLSGL